MSVLIERVRGAGQTPQRTVVKLSRPILLTSGSGRRWYGHTVQTVPGDYRLTAHALQNGAPWARDVTWVTVAGTRIEFQDWRARPEALMDAARKTGGHFAPADRAHEVLMRLRALPAGTPHERTIVTPLWDTWWLALIFLGSLIIEWTLRRRMIGW